jgi:hypothetical protein
MKRSKGSFTFIIIFLAILYLLCSCSREKARDGSNGYGGEHISSYWYDR